MDGRRAPVSGRGHVVCVARRRPAAAASSVAVMADSDDEFYDCDTDEGSSHAALIYSCFDYKRVN